MAGSKTTTTKKRTTTGCLSCRRRKVKCDEVKPVCKSCQRNFLPCSWPDYSEGRIRKRKQIRKDPKDPVPSDNSRQIKPEFVVWKPGKIKSLKVSEMEWKFEPYASSKEINEHQSCEHNNQIHAPVDDFAEITSPNCGKSANLGPSTARNDCNENSLIDNSEEYVLDLELQSLQKVDIPFDAMVLHEVSHHFEDEYGIFDKSSILGTTDYDRILRRYHDGELLSDDEFTNVDTESLLLCACLNGFLEKLTVQSTPPILTAHATFVPQSVNNMIMKKVFLCCGATYLAWHDLERFQALSDDLYKECKQDLQDCIKMDDFYADKDWIFAALQLLCNRDKNSFNGSVDDSMWHLAKTYEIISKRYGSYKMQGNNEDLCHFTLILQPQERVYIEFFIYHYSISVLLVRDTSIPNPFIIFKNLNHILKCPVYSCEEVVAWMKNPLLGSSLSTLEVVAKVSYIARMQQPLDEMWLLKINQLRDLCANYVPTVTSDGQNYLELLHDRINSIVGRLIMKSCWLFASKIIEFDSFDANDRYIQAQVEELVNCLRELPETHTIWGILPWPLLILGAFCRNYQYQEIILQRINIMAERAHTYCGVRMALFLNKVWDSNDCPGKGLDFLFDRELLAGLDL